MTDKPEEYLFEISEEDRIVWADDSLEKIIEDITVLGMDIRVRYAEYRGEPIPKPEDYPFPPENDSLEKIIEDLDKMGVSMRLRYAQYRSQLQGDQGVL